ncbi:MAG: ATP phosphoribosyltransferase regulatory subunit [Candidatus Pacearchaeota archaeon]|jgi:histidyl-tRNA synthetase
MNKETVKGFRDIENQEALKRSRIRKILVETFELYGFNPVETPFIEYEEFIKGENNQDEAVSDIFKLKDKGDRNLALRYEFTFQLKRLAENKKLPYKRYQIGEVFRDEPISGNRYRQFTQCDVDTISASIKSEAEILALASRIFKLLKIKNTIYINNRKLLNEILDSQNIKSKNEVLKEIDKIDKLPEKEILANLKKYNAEKILTILKNKEDYFKKFKYYSEIEELKKYLKEYGIKTEFQPFLVRGLSYYTGSIFEIKSDIKETICAGGTYLINGVTSTGISFGLDRLAIVSPIKFEKKELLILSLDQDKISIKITEILREKGINCSLMFGKPSKSLEYANANNIQYVLFIGDSEVKSKKFTLKDMKSGKESKIGEKELIKRLSE